MEKKQMMVVMRHGRRFDTDNPSFTDTAPHPWDTPLSDRGKKELQAMAPSLEPLQPELLVVSPFLRCMQTARVILRNMPLRPGGVRIVVEPWVSEVYSPYLLHVSENPGCLPIFKRWRWQRQWQSRAQELLGDLPNCTLQFSSHSFPHYPETRKAAHKRFRCAFEHWSARCNGNMIIVSHGDSVLSALKWMEVSGELSNVHPGGYLVASRTREPSLGKWQPDESLVQWNGIVWSRPPQITTVQAMTAP